jgi:hypothetical protein
MRPRRAPSLHIPASKRCKERSRNFEGPRENNVALSARIDAGIRACEDHKRSPLRFEKYSKCDLDRQARQARMETGVRLNITKSIHSSKTGMLLSERHAFLGGGKSWTHSSGREHPSDQSTRGRIEPILTPSFERRQLCQNERCYEASRVHRNGRRTR